jgi:hypothetical protein
MQCVIGALASSQSRLVRHECRRIREGGKELSQAFIEKRVQTAAHRGGAEFKSVGASGDVRVAAFESVCMEHEDVVNDRVVGPTENQHR